VVEVRPCPPSLPPWRPARPCRLARREEEPEEGRTRGGRREEEEGGGEEGEEGKAMLLRLFPLVARCRKRKGREGGREGGRERGVRIMLTWQIA